MDKLKEKCFQEFLESEYPTDPLESNAWRNAHMRKAFIAGWKAGARYTDTSGLIRRAFSKLFHVERRLRKAND